MILNHRILTKVFVLGTLLALNPLKSTHALEQDEISATVDRYTVRIDGAESGSGVIIKRDANIYTVLTNNHVVDSPEGYSVTTYSQNEYKVIPDTIRSVKGIDLAVFQFASNEIYSVVEVGDSNRLNEGSSIFTFGWSNSFKNFPDRGEVFLAANIVSRVQNPQNGYEILHDKPATKGTSGAPVFDSNARLIGINGSSSCKDHACFGLVIPIQLYLDNRDNQLPIVEITVPEDFISLGEEEAKKGNYRNAIAEYNKALQQEPENLLDIYYLRGEAFFAIKDYDAAIEDFSQFVRLSPQNYLAYFYRGYIRAENDDFSGAIADYNQAVEINSDFSLAYTNRGFAHSKLGNTQNAIADYSKAIEINPNSATAYHNRGLVFGRDLGDLEGALADFSKAIEIKPQDAQIYTDRGTVYKLQEQFQLAIDDYVEATKIDSQYAEAHYSLGIAYSQNNQPEKAIESLQRASSIFRSQEDDANYQRALDGIREIRGY